MKADYFLSEKKYRHAAYGYLELLQQEKSDLYDRGTAGGNPAQSGRGICASVFVSRKRQKCLQQLIRKTDQSRAGIVICML